MLAQSIMVEHISTWAASLVIVKKKDGSYKIFVNYWAEKDGHPIPTSKLAWMT